MSHRRVVALWSGLDAVVAGDEVVPDPGDAWSFALAGFAASFRLDHARAAELVACAVQAGPVDADARVLVDAVRALADAGTTASAPSSLDPWVGPDGDPIAAGEALLSALSATPVGAFSAYALAEAALACGRVAIADRIAAHDAAGLADAAPFRGHPYAGAVVVLVARAACFAGRVEAARRVLDACMPTGHAGIDLLVRATRALADGNAAEPAVVRAIARELMDAEDAAPVGRLASGTALLAAYGLVAIGDVARSATMVATIDRARAMVVDRALILELLAVDALREGDLDAAGSRLAEAEATASGPIADSTVARIRSRIALASGDPFTAGRAAELAVARATAEGRAIEAAEGEVLVARARLGEGRRADAARGLESAVARAEPEGHRAVRRAAGRELRGTGRRLRPVPGSGGDGLSAREREVVALLRRGASSAGIAAELHISPHTLRAHVARILVAYDAPSVLALLTSWATTRPPAPADVWSALTPRQREVVEAIVGGATTAEVGELLGIGTRTVEKHLTDAMRRWRVTGRAGLIARSAGWTAPE